MCNDGKYKLFKNERKFFSVDGCFEVFNNNGETIVLIHGQGGERDDESYFKHDCSECIFLFSTCQLYGKNGEWYGKEPPTIEVIKGNRKHTVYTDEYLEAIKDKSNLRHYDLYFCNQSGIPTILKRFGDNSADYTSGIGFRKNDHIIESAYRYAERLELIKQ